MKASFVSGLTLALLTHCGGRMDSPPSTEGGTQPEDAGSCAPSTQSFHWFLSGANPSSYSGGPDPAVSCSGTPSVSLRSTSQASSSDFATMMTTQNAAAFAGKRVRFRGWVRTQSLDTWAGLWMRVDEPNHQMGAFDNMANRPIHGTSWTRYDVVLDVAADAVDAAFGVLLAGNGEVWLDGALVEVVDDSVPTTGS